MRQPTEIDFDVELRDVNIEVTFKPTKKFYAFTIVDVGGALSLSDFVIVGSNDTGDYEGLAVGAMARRLAEAKLRGAEQGAPR
jgi:hypothetical protein